MNIPKVKVAKINMSVPKISVPKIGMVRMPNISYIKAGNSNIVRTKTNLK